MGQVFYNIAYLNGSLGNVHSVQVQQILMFCFDLFVHARYLYKFSGHLHLMLHPGCLISQLENQNPLLHLDIISKEKAYM